MKQLLVGTVATLVLMTWPVLTFGAQLAKCRQPDGSLLSLPGVYTCPDTSTSSNAVTTLEETNRRLNAADAALSQYRYMEQQQHSAAFVQAATTCRNRGRRMYVGSSGAIVRPDFDAVAKPDGTVKYVGTAHERFDFENCMQERGFPLIGK